MKSGIYKITNIATKNLCNAYVGKSVNLDLRFASHYKGLINNTHENPPLQRAFNKYGEENFVVQVLEYCSSEKLSERERYWENFHGFKNLYGCIPAKGNNLEFSKETRKKISDALKGHITTKETRKKIGDAHRGKAVSKKSRQKMSKAKQNMSEETKKKIGDFQRGKVQSEESNRKRSESMKGKNRGPRSEETKKKISESLKKSKVKK